MNLNSVHIQSVLMKIVRNNKQLSSIDDERCFQKTYWRTLLMVSQTDSGANRGRDCVQMERLNNSSIHKSLQVVCVSLCSAEGRTPPGVKCKMPFGMKWHVFFISAVMQTGSCTCVRGAADLQQEAFSLWTRFIFYFPSFTSTQTDISLLDWFQVEQIIHSFLVVHRFDHQGTTTRCGSWMCRRRLFHAMMSF